MILRYSIANRTGRFKKKSAYDRELEAYGKIYEKAEAKYKRQLRKDPEVRPEDFGLSSKMFDTLSPDTKSGRPSVRQIRQRTAELKEFTMHQVNYTINDEHVT